MKMNRFHRFCQFPFSIRRGGQGPSRKAPPPRDLSQERLPSFRLFFLLCVLTPTSVFAWVNPGFETGNLTGWTTSSGSGGGLVCGPPIVNTVSTATLQTTIPGISPDTIGPNTPGGMPMVHTGTYAAQLFSAH